MLIESSFPVNRNAHARRKNSVNQSTECLCCFPRDNRSKSASTISNEYLLDTSKLLKWKGLLVLSRKMWTSIIQSSNNSKTKKEMA